VVTISLLAPLLIIPMQSGDAGALATSPVKWKKYASNPLWGCGASGTWDYRVVRTDGLVVDSGIYYIYYTGGANSYSNEKIGVATSTDGVTWTKSAYNPIIGPGSAGTWESKWAIQPKVTKKDDTFYMIYDGNNNSKSGIGLATSSDGINFTKYASNPIIDNASPIWLMVDSGQFIMFYSDANGWWMANSTDCVNWTKNATKLSFQ
jgi:predicted GH43/DUF377 family glycosyl hydrolase